MGGIFGIASKEDCVSDLFYGTDYHSHLGTRYGGMAVRNGKDIERSIHNAQEAVQGSCSLLVLTEKGIYAARNRLGRTPLAIGPRNGARS
jgi:glutamine phosphoribosylpyrophosphate amidotransferase